jgi:hypothetical protein
MPQVKVHVTSQIKFYDDGAPVPVMAPFLLNVDATPHSGEKIRLTPAQVPDSARAVLQIGAPLDEAGEPYLHVAAWTVYHNWTNPLLPKIDLYATWPVGVPELAP